MPSINLKTEQAVIIRAGHGTLVFTTPEGEGGMTQHQYAVKSGMSLAANLRTAFKEEVYLAEHGPKAVLKVVSPVLLIPSREYCAVEEYDVEGVYGNTVTGHKGEVKVVTEIPEFDVHAIFPVNSDLQMVVGDHFSIMSTQNVMVDVWRHLYKNYYSNSGQRKLFAYFHDKQMDICAFEQNRIRFANAFDINDRHDALYYLLFVWKQLGMNQNEDMLYFAGETQHMEWLKEKTAAYVSNITVIEETCE